MDSLNAAILDFIRSAIERPFPPDTSTRLILTALRIHLDADAPDWRERAFANDPPDQTVIEIRLFLNDGREVQGALLQRPSAVAGEAA